MGSNVEENSEREIIDLVRETVRVLIDKRYWTHASQSSATFSLRNAKFEFNTVSHAERKRFIDRELSLINGECQIHQSDR
ncbi:DUF1517 domain-containing protein [Pleurocapsales cyanobacterium LEGE 10410]|nr:DUF1517 domain-containing protein [Pleurocapsales cyanobacterium LEGE 10410]